MSYQGVREFFLCVGGVGGAFLKSPYLAFFSGEVCLLVMNIAYCLKSRSIFFFLDCYFILEILGTFQVHDRCLTAFERFSRSPGSFDVTHS